MEGIIEVIDTVIFDIGNVLAGFEWEKFFESKGYTGEKLERLAGASVMSESWNEYDRGFLSDEETLQCFINNAPEMEKELRDVFANVKGMIERRDYAIPWIEGLKKKGYKVLYLSNFSHKALVECADAMDFLPHMDGGILSYREKVIKPMPEIYELLIQRYDLTPQNCVFIDDTEKNLTGASVFGLHTILFKSKAQAWEELEKLGVTAV